MYVIERNPSITLLLLFSRKSDTQKDNTRTYTTTNTHTLFKASLPHDIHRISSIKSCKILSGMFQNYYFLLKIIIFCSKYIWMFKQRVNPLPNFIVCVCVFVCVCVCVYAWVCGARAWIKERDRHINCGFVSCVFGIWKYRNMKLTEIYFRGFN